MIPEVKANTILTVISQEERDWKLYNRECIESFKQKQPSLHRVVFDSVDRILNRGRNLTDSPVLTQYKINAIIGLMMRCLYNQVEVNQLEEMFNGEKRGETKEG